MIPSRDDPVRQNGHPPTDRALLAQIWHATTTIIVASVMLIVALLVFVALLTVMVVAVEKLVSLWFR